MNKRTVGLLVLLLFVLSCAQVLAEGPDEGEDRGTVDRFLDTAAVPTEITMMAEIEEERPKPVLPAEQVSIKEVRVIGVTGLSEKEIAGIIGPFQNAKLTGKDMQRCADQITDTYALKGYLTSYAYVDPEKLSEGVLEVKAVEGKIGQITIEGNQYFSSDIYEKKLGFKEGDIVNYTSLRNNIYRINKNMDRKAKLELKAGQEPGLTDITVMVTDKLPYHFTFNYDNYGSFYILNNRYKAFFISNNLTGNDDSISLKVQMTEADTHKLYDIDYFLPITNNLKWELYLMPYKMEDYEHERQYIDMEKRAQKTYSYLYYTLVDRPGCEIVANVGFVYKDILWYAYGARQKWDRFRAGLFGFDINIADKWGRTIISNDTEFGIPEIWGGAHRKNDYTSVTGARGDYKKTHFIFARRQKLIDDIELLLKSHLQLSSCTLTGVNGFSVGGFFGVIDNRGYPRAQYEGDSGYSFTPSIAFPAYFVPRDVKVPFSKAKLYDSLKLFTFFDWAEAILKSPKEDKEKKRTLRSAGFGLTLNLPEAFSMRVDCAWPLDRTPPGDGDHFHTWVSMTKSF